MQHARSHSTLVTTSQRTKRRDFVLQVIASFERFGIREDECFCQQIDPGAAVDWETQWMTRAEQASVIPCFVCAEYPMSKACVDEFKYARNARKLLVIALSPLHEIASLPIDEGLGNGPVVGHFKKGEQCLLSWPGAPPGDAEGSDFSKPEVVAEYIYTRWLRLG